MFRENLGGGGLETAQQGAWLYRLGELGRIGLLVS